MDIFQFNTDTITKIDLNYDDVVYVTIPSHINANKVVDIKVESITSPSIYEMILPNTLERISSLFFDKCPSFKKLVFQDQLKIIDKLLFNNCTNFTELVFPKNIQQINCLIFENCNQLKSLTAINENLTINSIKIKNCPNLQDVSSNLYKVLPSDVFEKIVYKKIDDWSNISKIDKENIIKFTTSCKTSIKMKLLSKYPFILKENFNKNFNLSIYHIDKLFEYSSKIKDAEFGAVLLNYKVKNYSESEITKYNDEKNAFLAGVGLPTFDQLTERWNVDVKENEIRILGYKGTDTSDFIPTGVLDGRLITAIISSNGSNFFPLENLTIEAKIKYIASRAFAGCSSLKNVLFIEDTIEYVSSYCFNNCIGLTSIEFPKSVKSIQKRAFDGCVSLKKITFANNSITEISDNCFDNCVSLAEIIIPEGVKNIAPYAFNDCLHLKKVTFPNTLQIIMYQSFAFCIELEEIDFPPSLLRIMEEAFIACEKLTNVKFNSEVEVREYAFKHCRKLKLIEK